MSEFSMSNPVQHLPKSQKTLEWHKQNLETFLVKSNHSYYYEKDRVNYDLLNGIINQKEFEYITKPYGISPKATLPEDLQHYPIITPNIKVLEGEYIQRPNNERVYAINPEAISEYLNFKDEQFNQLIISTVKQARMEHAIEQNPELAQNQEALAKMQEEIISPEEIQEKLTSFKDSYETMGKELLIYFRNQLELKHEFRKAFLHGLTSAKEVYHIYGENDEPRMKTVNPLRFYCDLNTNANFIHEGEWAVTIDYLTPSKVIEIYNDHLNHDEEKKIYEYAQYGLRSVETGWQFFDTFDNFLPIHNQDANKRINHIQVVHCVWRSWYKIGFLKFMDENGEEQLTEVAEGYKLNKEIGDISITWDWYPEIRECTKIGRDIYVKAGVVEDTPKDPDNPFNCPLPYTGVIHNNLNSVPTSAVDLMKPYQYFYNIIKRMIQKDLASDKGRKLLANINQVPTSLGIDLDKWQHYMEIDDVIWVNPNEEGNKGNNDLTSWRSVDMTAAQSINQKIELLEYIEAKCKGVIGLNDPRVGQAGNRDLVGTTQLQVAQSMAITEPWYATHELGKKAALTQLLNAAKYYYRKKPNKKLVYVTSDSTKHIIELDTEKLANAAYGVFVSSATEDVSRFNELKEMTKIALQSQIINLSTISKMISGEATPTQITREIEKGEQKLAAQQQQSQQQTIEAQMQLEKEKRELEYLKMQMEKYKIDSDNATKIRVAEISAFRFQENLDANNDGQIDFMELEQERINKESDRQLKQLELDINKELSQKQMELDKQMKEKEMAIKEKELTLKNKDIDTKLKIARANKNKYDK